MIRRNSKRSIRKLASAAGISYGTMQHVIKKDLNLFPYKNTRYQLLSHAAKSKRLQRGRLLLEKFQDGTPPPILWTDEKIFTVQVLLSHQNDRIYAVNKQGILLNDRFMFQRKKQHLSWSGLGWFQLEKKLPTSSMKKCKCESARVFGAIQRQIIGVLGQTLRSEKMEIHYNNSSHTANLVQEWLRGIWCDFAEVIVASLNSRFKYYGLSHILEYCREQSLFFQLLKC